MKTYRKLTLRDLIVMWQHVTMSEFNSPFFEDEWLLKRILKEMKRRGRTCA